MVARQLQSFGLEQGLLSFTHPPFSIDPDINRVVIGAGAVCADPQSTVPAFALLSQVGIVGVEDRQFGSLQQSAFDRPVILQGAVPFEVIGSQRGPDADCGVNPFSGFDLVTAEFHDQPVGVVRRAPLELKPHLGR